MTKLNMISVAIVMIGFMSACTMSDRETATSHSVSADAEKNALEAEQAELELAKLAELQKQSEPKAGKNGKSGRKPASTGTATVVKAEKKAEKKPEKKSEKKASKTAEVKPEAKAPVAPHENTVAAPAPAVEVAQESPQAKAKKEIAAGEASVLKAKPAMKVAMNTDPAQQPVTKTLKAHSTKSVASSVYIVQVGAFRVKENAAKLEEKLKGDGFPVRTKEVNHSKNGMLYVVQFEPTPNRDEADAWRSQVKAKASLDAQLVARPD